MHALPPSLPPSLIYSLSVMHQLLLSFPECLSESLAQDTVSVFTGDAMGLVQLIRKARQMDRKPPLYEWLSVEEGCLNVGKV